MSDISKKQDLTMAVAHLANLEEHAKMSYMKTKNKEYLEVNSFARKMRRKYMEMLNK